MMLLMKKPLIWLILMLMLFMGCASCMQEKMLFHPHKLDPGHRYLFDVPFEEINYQTADKVSINALHFKTPGSRGVVFYLHGNAGALDSWGNVAGAFTSHGYDVLIIDYRGFGKSTGKMSEKGLYSDAQFIYNKLKEKYAEDKIVVYGRSIGTGIASYIAAHNAPGKLILETPYYNLRDLVKSLYPIAPAFLLRYSFKTNEYLPKVKCPVYVFHGTEDEVIYYGSSIKLRKFFKPGDTLFTIQGGRHNNLSAFEDYHNALKQALQ
jgi:uncharacterized protein